MSNWRLLFSFYFAFTVSVCSSAQLEGQAPGGAAVGPKSAPKIHFAAPLFNFGRIPAGTVLNLGYEFRNEGTERLTITDVFPSCGCTTVGEFPVELEPGQTGRIPIRFDSTGFDGLITKEVVIFSNDPDQPEVALVIEGTVYSSITLSPSDAVFASFADASASETKIIKITNNTEEPLILTAPESNSPSFRAELKTVQSGKEFELLVTAVPPFGTGGVRGHITLKTNSPERSALTVTCLVVVQKPITVLPSAIWMPAAPATQSRVTIRNNSGMAGFALFDPAVNLPGVSAVVQEVEKGRVFSVVLTFPAGVVLSAGLQGELTVKTNHPRFPIITVPIRPPPRRA